MRIAAINENSCIVYLGEDIDVAVSRRVAAVVEAVCKELGAAILDVIPSYASVHLTLDPSRLSVAACCERLERLVPQALARPAPESQGRLVEIPAWYDTEVAPDLEAVAEHAGMSPAEVAEVHSSTTYRIYAIGFAPGFCFLGTTDPRLHIPRLETPRRSVPAGSIGLADAQTAVYPSETPGGWRLIGRAAIDILGLCNDEAAPLQVGDEIRFVAVDRDGFIAAGGSL